VTLVVVDEVGFGLVEQVSSATHVQDTSLEFWVDEVCQAVLKKLKIV
jgi:hypothetical protein